MPRTKLDKHSKTGRREIINRAVRQAMVRNDVRTQKQLGQYLGLTEHQINYRFDAGFKDDELFQIGLLLHFTEDEKTAILGGG